MGREGNVHVPTYSRLALHGVSRALASVCSCGSALDGLRLRLRGLFWKGGGMTHHGRAIGWELYIPVDDPVPHVLLHRLPDENGERKEDLRRRLGTERGIRFVNWVFEELTEGRGRLVPQTRGWLYVRGIVKGGL